MKRILMLTFCAGALVGCGALPAQGPVANSVESAATTTDSHGTGYELIDFDERVSDVLKTLPEPSLHGSFGDKRPAPRQRIGVGDTVTVSVFESAPGGLFSPPAASITTGSRQQVLPNQVVDQEGRIDVPYGGRVRAAGRTPTEVARDIERALAGRAIEPQVVVSLIENSANTASVLGEVGSAGRVKLALGGDRLLTVLASAGGAKGLETEINIRLMRGSRVEAVPLRTIASRPSENIYIFPGDTIFLYKEPQAFNVFGAVQKPSQYPIDSVNLTLADALGRAGGLLDQRADAGGVFLFRFESPRTVKTILGREPTAVASDNRIPVVYRIRFSDPRSFLWLQKARIRHNDVLYAANSLSVEFEKFISIVDKTASIGMKVSSARRTLLLD